MNANPILLQAPQLLGLQEAFISSPQSSLVFLVRHQPVGVTEAHPTGRAGGNNASPALLSCQEAQTLPELPRERGSHLLAQPSEHLPPLKSASGHSSQQRDLSAKRSFFPPGPRPQEGRAAHAPSPATSPRAPRGRPPGQPAAGYGGRDPAAISGRAYHGVAAAAGWEPARPGWLPAASRPPGEARAASRPPLPSLPSPPTTPRRELPGASSPHLPPPREGAPGPGRAAPLPRCPQAAPGGRRGQSPAAGNNTGRVGRFGSRSGSPKERCSPCTTRISPRVVGLQAGCAPLLPAAPGGAQALQGTLVSVGGSLPKPLASAKRGEPLDNSSSVLTSETATAVKSTRSETLAGTETRAGILLP